LDGENLTRLSNSHKSCKSWKAANLTKAGKLQKLHLRQQSCGIKKRLTAAKAASPTYAKIILF